MPLTEKGEKIKSALTKEYGEKKGEQVLYAGKNKGTFSGIDAAMQSCADAIEGLHRRADVYQVNLSTDLAARIRAHRMQEEIESNYDGSKYFRENWGKSASVGGHSQPTAKQVERYTSAYLSMKDAVESLARRADAYADRCAKDAAEKPEKKEGEKERLNFKSAGATRKRTPEEEAERAKRFGPREDEGMDNPMKPEVEALAQERGK